MKTPYQSIISKDGTQVAFELPEGISFTNRKKEIKAIIKYDLRYSGDTCISGSCHFKSMEDAKAAYNHNVNLPNVRCQKPIEK